MGEKWTLEMDGVALFDQRKRRCRVERDAAHPAHGSFGFFHDTIQV
jgi:hypothetical protein